MPELPEVETVARCLRSRLEGESICGVRVLLERIVACPDAHTFAHEIVGRTFTSFGRRGKYLLAELDPEGWLVLHFRMSGRLCFMPAADPPGKHTRMILELESGRALWLNDQRTFGRVWLVENPDVVTADLGPEPLSDVWTLERFVDDLKTRRRMIKPLLLDQTFVAGLGNIYVDEALHRASLHPAVRADRLSEAEISRLHDAVRVVLSDAIAHGGTTLRDYLTPEGDPGEHQDALRVYGRQGESCATCATPIVKIRLAQRGTHFCPVCQPAPDELRDQHADGGSL